MKKTTNLTAAAIAAALVTGGSLAVPQAAQADFSATVGAANMYLWRGLNLTPDGAQVSGSLDFSTGGFYLGGWTSTETEGHETDFYLGYGGEVGGFSYDISYWKYLYPEERTGAGLKIPLGDSDASEYVASVGYGPVAFTAYISAESGADDNKYYTLAGTFGDFTLTYGMWDLEFGTIAGVQDEYSHLTLTYAFNENLTFGVSVADSDLPDTDDASVEDDPLFLVSYSKTFDMK